MTNSFVFSFLLLDAFYSSRNRNTVSLVQIDKKQSTEPKYLVYRSENNTIIYVLNKELRGFVVSQQPLPFDLEKARARYYLHRLLSRRKLETFYKKNKSLQRKLTYQIKKELENSREVPVAEKMHEVLASNSLGKPKKERINESKETKAEAVEKEHGLPTEQTKLPTEDLKGLLGVLGFILLSVLFVTVYFLVKVYYF